MKFHTRTGSLLLSSVLSLAFVGSAQAIDFGGLKEKANAAISASGTDSTALLQQGQALLKSFSGNEQLTGYAKGLMQSLSDGKYANIYDYYDKIGAAKLTPDQLATWNDVKSPLSAYVLEQNFSYTDSGLADLVNKAASSLKKNDTESAGNYLSQLKSAATLTSGQKSLLGNIQSNLLPTK